MADKDFIVKNSLTVNTDFVANSLGIFIGNSVSNASINSTIYTGSANNASYLGGLISSGYVNTAQLAANLSNYAPVAVAATITGTRTYTANIQVRNANLVINTTAGIIANGSAGVSGQALLSNGTTVYWASVNSSVITAAGSNTQIQFNDGSTLAASAGLFYNKTSNTVTIGNSAVNSSINSTSFTGTANNASNLGGTSAASYALKTDTTYIGTTPIALNRTSSTQTINGISIDGTANNSLYLGGTIASSYQLTSFLSANVATLTANNTSFVGTVSAANVVSNTQLQGNLSFYTTTASLQSSGLVAKASTLSQGGGSGAAITFNYSGQSGQPSWLWGTNDGTSTNVWNPSNFNVNSATSSINANNASFLGGTAASSYLTNGSSNKTLYSLSTNVLYDSSNVSFYVVPAGNSRLSAIYADVIYSYGNITAYYSDGRLKKDIKVIPDAIEKLKLLYGVTYKGNDLAKSFGFTDDSEQVGVIAQDVEKVLPQVVKHAPFDIGEGGASKTGDHYKTVQYERIVPLLIEAIKELHYDLRNLKDKLEKD
jgi:hypothetical protein